MSRTPLLLVLAALVLPAVAGAQVRPRPQQPRTQPPVRDTIPRQPSRDTIPRRPAPDTTPAPRDTTAIRWVEEDSVTRALLSRPGYTVTRYQGPILTFDALTRAIDIFIGRGDTTRVAVQRGDRLIVADTAITYSEATGIARATGRVIIREGESELTGLGGEYNLRERSVTIRGGRTQVRTEENWFVGADTIKVVQVDSVTNQQNVFGRHGNLTSCDLAEHGGVPHYHFSFRELKRTAGNTMVARPAVLYISDIPVMWLPFVFQDMRPGRRSGLLTPRIGFTDFIRNSPSYRRNVENIGWYWAISDYMDLEVALDWLSNTGRDAREAPGWTRYNGEWRYNWLDRFLSGSLASSFTRQGDGTENLAVSWYHNQEFTRDRSLRANVNWMQNTTVQRETYVNPLAVLATISSSVNLQDRIGPARVALGATRKQFSGRDEVEETLPTLSITTGTLNLTPWLAWTPNFQMSQQRRTDITQPSQFGVLFRDEEGQIVVDSVRQNERRTTASFDTPIELFGYNLRNSFQFNDREFDAPQLVTVVSADTTLPPQDRIFARTYLTTLDWTPSFSLPTFAQGTWNLAPTVSLANVYGGAPFMVRSQFSGGEWIRQQKRPTFGLGIRPTFYGLLPGFWGFSRFRHAITTGLSYTYAPKAGVSDEFLLAQNVDPRGYIGAIPQNQFSLTFGTNLEGKGHPQPGDTSATAESAPKVKVLSLDFSGLSYDVARYQKTGDLMRGLTTNTFSTTVDSDLLPGVDLSFEHELFSGDNFNSDTAVFSPFLARVSGAVQFNAQRNPLILLARLFGRAVPANQTAAAEIVEPLDDAAARAAAARPIAGTRARQTQMLVPAREGWQASFTFSSSRQRPPRGGNIIEFDPTVLCQPLLAQSQIAFDRCVAETRLTPTTELPVTGPQPGGAFYRVPPTTSIGSALSFALTPKWTGTWNTSYDVERGEFASHMVSLQRDLHDWRAVFNFTQSPTGSFAFSFFIALKAEPDLKFDYNRATYRREVRAQ